MKKPTTQDTDNTSGTVTYNKGARLDAYSIRPGRNGAIWVRAGVAFVNRDGSLNVHLDVLPLDGKLHLRTPLPRVDGKDAPEAKDDVTPPAAA